MRFWKSRGEGKRHEGKPNLAGLTGFVSRSICGALNSFLCTRLFHEPVRPSRPFPSRTSKNVKMTLRPREPVTQFEKVCKALAAEEIVNMRKRGSEFVAVTIRETLIQQIQKSLRLFPT